MVQQAIGSLAVAKLSFKLKLINSIIKQICSFLMLFFMQGGFFISDIVFGCDNPTNKISSAYIY